MKGNLTILLGVFLVSIAPHPAFANAVPGGVALMTLFGWVLLPVMMVLTLAGGGYAILAHRRKKDWGLQDRRRVRWLAFASIFVLAVYILLGELGFLAGSIVGFTVMIVALSRAVRMLRWGWLARRGTEAPEYLAEASPWRLLFAGGTLLFLSLLLFGTSVVATIFENTPSSKSRIARAASDTKVAVTQAIVYARDKGVYPTSMKVLREAGYAIINDTDPWKNSFVLSPVLTSGAKPRDDDDVYVYSKGPKGTGTYPPPLTGDTGEGGSVGYSAVYGSWMGR